MDKRSTKKGFTLIELMVAMAIIAALIGMSVFGINLVQRSERNTKRRAALNNINLAVRNHQIDNGVYPLTSELVFTANDVSIDGQVVAELTGPAKAVAASVANPGSDGSHYCYNSATGSTFSMSVSLEGTDDFMLSSESSTSASCTGTVTVN
jgi:prepilin-type N-terminal cleavage/methylation domain-containing protein